MLDREKIRHYDDRRISLLDRVVDAINNELSAILARLDALEADHADTRRKLEEAQAAISSVPCCDCNGPVVEFSIPNETWNVLIRQGGPETDKEYLCVECFIRRIEPKLRELAETANAEKGGVE